MTSLRLVGFRTEIDLYPWLSDANPDMFGIEAMEGITGFGLAPVEPRWFEGAGVGSRWRGSRVGRRPVEIPLRVQALDRAALNEMVSDIARALDPNMESESRLFFGMPDGEEWYLDVVRVGGGDWSRKKDSDDETYFETSLQLIAGYPYWTRVRPEEFQVIRDNSGRGLLPALAELKLSSAAAFGVQEVENVGDADAWPVWLISGPLTSFKLVGALGETMIWESDLEAGETLKIDSRANTIVDQNGANRYDGFTGVPKFWPIKPRTSIVTAEATDTGPETLIYCRWSPQRWAVV